MVKMVNLFSNKLEILIFLTCLIDRSREYQKRSIEDDELCSPITKGNISLGIGKTSALIVSLDNITALKEQENKWEDDFICEFQISIPQHDEGIYAVIQNIVFRKNYTTNECIDYVEYRRHDGTLSGKYCGQMGIDYQFQANDSLVTTNSFVEHNASLLNVYINISKCPLEADENLELEIVFTSFRNCLKNFSFIDRDSWCWEGFTAHCIARSFSGDGYFNCPYYKCSDEGGCLNKFESETPSPTSSQRRGDYIAILLLGTALIVGFMMCIFWNLRKKVFAVLRRCYSCCSRQTADEPTVNENEEAVEMDTTVPSEYHEDAPPSYHDVVPREESPPTYESLFSE